MYIVTGSSSGIGNEIYKILKEKENFVIGLDLKNSDFIVDVSNFKNIENFVNKLYDQTKEIFGIVTCAGVSSGDNIINTNYFGSIDLINLLSKKINIKSIVLVGSALSNSTLINKNLLNFLIDNKKEEANNYIKIQNLDDMTVYATTKKALDIYCKNKFIDNEIQINIVHPGLVKTNMTSKIINNIFFDKLFINKFNQKFPQYMQPIEVAKLIYFLLKNESITKQSIFIDKGFIYE